MYFKFIMTVQVITNVISIFLAAYVLLQLFKLSKQRLDHVVTKNALRNPGIYDPEVAPSPDESEVPVPVAQVESVFDAPTRTALLNVPSATAGNSIEAVPNLDPTAESGWESRRQVVTSSHVVVYTYQGTDPMELIELDGGYVLACIGSKVALLRKMPLLKDEERALMHERDDFIRTWNDQQVDDRMPSFKDKQWTIRGAYGDNPYKRPGEAACSHMVISSVMPGLTKEDAVKSFLPGGMFDRKEHDYFDIRAASPDSDEYLIGFYVAGQWLLLIGRLLTDAEVAKMRVA